MPVSNFSIRVFCFCALVAALYAACSTYFIQALPIAMLFCGVGGAKHFAADLVELVPALKRTARRAVFEKWGGRYYTFDGAQVRLCLLEGSVWIVEADVRTLISPPVSEREQRLLGDDYAAIPGTTLHGYSERGLSRLLEIRLMRRGGEPEMKKFFSWLQNEALPNVKRFPTSSFL
jgi:hypothetical protein